MKPMKTGCLILAVLLLSACVADGLIPQQADSSAQDVYVCRNGEVVSALYGSQGKAARVTVGGVTVQVDPVQAPFGEKFRADDGTTFWVNGQDVLLEWQDGAMLFCREKAR